jgi:hypothetical protein
MLEEKNVQSKKYQLGQFFTPVDMVQDILKQIAVDADIIVEPSFGGCGFIEPMIEHYPGAQIVGIELDKEWFDLGQERYPHLDLYHKNFYDIDQELVFDTKKVSFIGNVPFRSPAYSLTTHKKYVKDLAHRYKVTGIREEAVFFIIKTADIMIRNCYDGGIHYIIPKSLITNDSKFYKQFKQFIKKYFTIVSVFDLDPAKFDNVAQGLIMLSMKIGGNTANYEIMHNGTSEPVDSVIQLVSTDIPFHDIFKKTYLGSVPAESFLLSCPDESSLEFRKRLVKIFNEPTTVSSLKTDLQHNGKYNLKILSNKDTVKVNDKLTQICAYIDSIKAEIKDLTMFNDPVNYVPIQHRKESRYYFRNQQLKKCSFVYEINPNPQPSFYFTSNPSDGSTDYFGYCHYDISRNSSPGCCRTVPIDNIEDNLTDDFKIYWNRETNHLPYIFVFAYIKHISSTAWYRAQKKLRRRFYFCLPSQFDQNWIKQFDELAQEKEKTIIAGFFPVAKETFCNPVQTQFLNSNPIAETV